MDIHFEGQADYNLDAKNRLTVPARYRELLKGGLVVTKDFDPCVAIWPVDGFADFRRRSLEHLHPMSPRARKLKQFLASSSWTGSLDGAGRIPLQAHHLQHGDLTREVAVVGAEDHLQVWNREAWKAHDARLVGEINEFINVFDDLPAS